MAFIFSIFSEVRIRRESIVLTFGTPVAVDRVDYDDFREEVGYVSQDAKDLSLKLGREGEEGDREVDMMR